MLLTDCSTDSLPPAARSKATGALRNTHRRDPALPHIPNRRWWADAIRTLRWSKSPFVGRYWRATPLAKGLQPRHAAVVPQLFADMLRPNVSLRAALQIARAPQPLGRSAGGLTTQIALCALRVAALTRHRDRRRGVRTAAVGGAPHRKSRATARVSDSPKRCSNCIEEPTRLCPT